MEVGGRGGARQKTCVASTNAADRSLPHLVTCSHHVLLGFRSWDSESASHPPGSEGLNQLTQAGTVLVVFAIQAGQKQVVRPVLGTVEAVHNQDYSLIIILCNAPGVGPRKTRRP